MKPIKFVNKSVYCLGDIHGNFNQIPHVLSMYNITNSVVIVVGDCGVGFNNPTYYKSTFKYLNQKMQENDNTLIMIRGNHDNPLYFNKKPYRYSNLMTVRDYTIINIDLFGGEEYNILCIGGGISIDRKYRMDLDNELNRYKHQNSTNRHVSYWEDERIIVDYKKIDKITCNIDCLATHVNHLYNNGVIPQIVKNFSEKYNDVSLIDDILEENENMQKIYKRLIDNGHKLSKWVHGHYHKDIHYFDIYKENRVYIHSLNNIESPKYKIVEIVRGY